MPCRTFESLEVVGLIFHRSELVEACSSEALIKGLQSLLQALSTTKSKVGVCLSRNLLSHLMLN